MIKVWNLETGEYLYDFPEITNKYHIGCLSLNDELLAAGDYSRRVLVYSVKDRKLLATFQQTEMAYDLAFSPDHKYLLASLPNSLIEVYDMESMQHSKTLKGHKSSVPYSALSQDYKYLVSCSNTEVIIWDAKTLDNILTIEEKIYLCSSKHRLLMGILHDGLYKKFNTKLLH